MEFNGNISTTNKSNGVSHYVLLLIGFFIVTFLVYLPTLHSKFVFDFINMVFDIQNRPSLFNFSHGILFDFVNRFVFQLWLKLFGFNVWAWHFLQCFLHSLNGVLLYAFMVFVLRHFHYSQSRGISILIALCFLFNPYQTEPLVWGGDLNYLLVSNFILLNLLAFALFLQTRQKRYGLAALFAMGAGAFTHELGWFIIVADIILAVTLSSSIGALFSKSNFKYGLAAILLIALYFLNKLASGNLFGHYGSAVHLRFKLSEIVPVFYQYLFKIIFLGGFYPGRFLSKLYLHLNGAHTFYVLVVAVLIAIMLLVRYMRRASELRATFGLFLLFTLFVFPILNLYFPYWIKIQGDRYCYITSAFLLASCITLLYNFRPWLAWLFSYAYLIGSAYFLSFNIQSWHQAGSISMQLEKDYHWQNAAHVYVLNLPDNYRGAYMYRSHQPSAFAASFIKNPLGMPDGRKITEVLSYNLNAPADSVMVQINAEDELQVTLSANGTWWWRDTKGATNYDDSLVTVHLDEYNHSYNLKIKQKQPGDVFLYCANGRWREVQNF